ncbi:group-specific protein [Bacillus cereus E33L]|uniref:Group-specific protein n=2 Tax=Bacillus cereus group TaxID=86661 RepID=Q63EM8_BACCZ|nr:group-specific protein [Bacillus cereus E33L]
MIIYDYIRFLSNSKKELYNMEKKSLLSQQINSVPSDALNTPSKEQEQMLETSSQDEQNSNKKDVNQSLYGADLPISDVDRTTNKK